MKTLVSTKSFLSLTVSLAVCASSISFAVAKPAAPKAAKKETTQKEAATQKSTTLDLTKSTNKVEFLVTGDLGGISVPGTLSKDYKGAGPLQGELQLTKNILTGSSTYELNALTTGIGLRDNHMKNKYLEVEKHPQAKLTLKPVTLPETLVSAASATQTVPFEGTMEVKSKSHPITGQLTATKKDQIYDLKFKWDMKLTDFGIETPSFMDVTLTEKVSLDVAINGSFNEKPSSIH